MYIKNNYAAGSTCETQHSCSDKDMRHEASTALGDQSLSSTQRSVSVYMSVCCMSMSLSVCLALSLYLSLKIPPYFAACLWCVDLSIHLVTCLYGLSVCLSQCLYQCISSSSCLSVVGLIMSVNLSIYMFVYMSVCLSVYLSLPVCQKVSCLSECLCISVTV